MEDSSKAVSQEGTALPDPERLGPDSDFAPFVAGDVEEGVQRAALRRLFAQPEFNARDGLDTYAGDYRCFSELGDQMTSDLRHRLSLREAAPPAPTEHRSPAAEKKPIQTAAPLAPEEPARLGAARYVSLGRVLIAGPEGRAEEALSRLPAGASGWLLVSPDPPAAAGGSGGGVRRSHGRLTRLHGYLGRFRAWAEVAGREVDLAATTGVEHFDLVLDLGEPPLLEGAFPPPGYLAPGKGKAALDRALHAVSSLSGELERPCFLRYRGSLCAHGQGRLRGCARCLAVCPAGALAGAQGRIRLDPHLCHDCGACAAACPTGALANEAPWLSRFRDGLAPVLSRGAPVVFRGEGDAEPEGLAAGLWVDVVMESVWAAGMELWLAALAAGAPAVRVAVPPRAPAGAAAELSRQLAATCCLLQALGRREDALAFWAAPGEAPAPLEPGRSPAALPELWRLDDPRGTIRRAVDSLRSSETALPESVALPDGSPFGEVVVDPERCTLCMACVGVCRCGALLAGSDRPRLGFREAACTQCGLCEEACPERALSLRSRYHLGAQLASEERTLHAEEPFACVRCGAPFATRKMVDRIAEKLIGHWMFSDETALRRVRMCRNCRVVDRLEDQEAQGAPDLPG